MQSVLITTNVVSLNPANNEVYWIQYHVIKFVSDLRKVGTLVPSTNKAERHDISEILLKVALNTINQPNLNQKSLRYTLFSEFKSFVYCRAMWLNELGTVVVLPNNSYKPITNMVWGHIRLCRLQKRVHSTRSRK